MGRHRDPTAGGGVVEGDGADQRGLAHTRTVLARAELPLMDIILSPSLVGGWVGGMVVVVCVCVWVGGCEGGVVIGSERS